MCFICLGVCFLLRVCPLFVIDTDLTSLLREHDVTEDLSARRFRGMIGTDLNVSVKCGEMFHRNYEHCKRWCFDRAISVEKLQNQHVDLEDSQKLVF